MSATLARLPLRIAGPGRDGYGSHDPAYRRILIGLTLGGVATFVLLYYVQPLLPALSRTYAVSAGHSAAALSVSTIAMAVALLAVGPLSDAVGRVPLMRWSLIAAGVLGLASAFAPTWSTLLVLRGLTGAALAVLPAVALAYLREEVHPTAHAGANAAYITGTAVGGTLGRLLPVAVEPWLGWTGTTVLAAGITLAAAVGVWLLLPASRGFTRTSARPRRVVAGTVATLRDPVLVSLCLIGGTVMGVFVGIYNAIGFRLRTGDFALTAGATLIYLAYPVGIAAPWVARLASTRFGRGRTIVAGLVVLPIGLLITASSSLPVMMIGLGVVTFAFFCAHSLASGAVVERAQQVGVGVAQASSSYLFTYYVGSAVFGAVSTHSWQVGGWSGVLTTALLTAAVALSAGVFSWRRTARAAIADRRASPRTR